MDEDAEDAFEDAYSKLGDAKRAIANDIAHVGDYISRAMAYAIDGWLMAHDLMAGYTDSYATFQKEAAFAGSETLGHIQIKAARLEFWLLGDPDIPAEKPFSMEEWKSAAYALIGEARTAIKLTKRDCR